VTDREIFERFGYDPDDPVPRDDEGERIIPDKLLRALAAAPLVDPGKIPKHANWETQSEVQPGELTALLCVSHGMSYKTAARTLGRAIETVQTQLKAARYRLRVSTTAHACCEAIRRGLIP
jgi:DNA-binding CsgD family transcriptional regulator